MLNRPPILSSKAHQASKAGKFRDQRELSLRRNVDRSLLLAPNDRKLKALISGHRDKQPMEIVNRRNKSSRERNDHIVDANTRCCSQALWGDLAHFHGLVS